MADGKVVIQVDMDGNKAQSGVERLKSMMGGLAESGERVGSVFKSVLGANIVSGALIAGVQSLGNALKSVFSTALDEGAKLQQSFGGIDTLYKGAEDTMKQYATTAAAAGISANTYAEQAVSFGASLKKALGGDAVKAAESANKAIMAMADNSAKMGTDIGSIQMAYQGFAKGNYTMLDNLKLGYGGTQQEMQRLLKDASKLEKAMGKKFDINNFADIVEAIDLVQQELGVAGVAAEEAKTTFSGSFAAMKASASNFLANLALGEDIGPSLKALVSTTSTFLLGNFLPMVGNIMRQLPQAIETALAEAGPKIEQGFKSLFASLGVDEGVFDSFKDTFRDVIVTAQSLFESFTGEASGFGNVIQGVSNIIETANTMIQNLAMGFQFALEAFENTGAIQNAYQAFKDLSEAALDLAVKLGDAIPWEAIGEAAGHVVNAISSIVSWISKISKSMSPEAWKTIIITIGVVLATFKTLSFLESFNPFGLFAQKATEGANEVVKGATKSKSLITKIFNGIGTIIKSLGQGIATAAKGLGSGLSTAFKGLGQGISTAAQGIGKGISIIAQGLAKAATMASPAQWLSMGAALLMVGAGVALVAGGFYILAQAAIQLGSAGTGAQIAMVALVVGIATLAGIFALLAPALTAGAVGLLAFGATVLMIGAGIAVAALAIAVLVDAIANGFALIVNTISSNAPQIISIIQAIAEGIRTGMDGVANIIISVGMAINIALQGIADIFKSVGEAISTAAQGIGKAIETVFNGISTVITATGDAIRTILDGIANVFESIGNAARNAGLGVKSMAEGIQLLVGLNLIDLASTLTVVSAGLTAIANSGIATAGPGLQQAGTGLMLIATSAQLASLALQSVPTALSSLSTSLGTLPETLTSAGASMSAFASSVMASFASLSGSVTGVMMLQTGLMALANAMMMAQSGASAMSSTLTMINASASSASSAITLLATGINSAMTQAVASVQSSMLLIVTVILQSSIQMTQAGQQAGRGVSEGITNGIRSGIGSAMSAMSTMVSSIRATAMSGVSAMRYVGSMIGQGLASGMYSALGAVTAAADALVAQAERAAQAKAKIHSPSRLFRDNVGRYISQGVAVGILADAHKVDDAMGDVFDQIKAFNFAPEDILGVGQTSLTKTLQVKSDLDRQIKASVKVAQEKSNRIVEQALEVAENAVKRPVNMMMESGVLVGQIGQQMTEFQNDKLMIDNMMRGII